MAGLKEFLDFAPVLLNGFLGETPTKPGEKKRNTIQILAIIMMLIFGGIYISLEREISALKTKNNRSIAEAANCSTVTISTGQDELLEQIGRLKAEKSALEVGLKACASSPAVVESKTPPPPKPKKKPKVPEPVAPNHNKSEFQKNLQMIKERRMQKK